MKHLKIASYSRALLFLLGISFLLWNCEKEELTVVKQKTNELAKIKKAFTTSFESKTFPFLKAPLWKKMSESYFNGEKYYEIPFDNLEKFNLQKSTSLLTHKLVAKKVANNYQLEIVLFVIPLKTNKQLTEISLDNFKLKNTNIIFFDLKGTVKDRYSLKKGKYLKNRFKVKLIDKNNLKQAKMPVEEENCTSTIYDVFTRTCWDLGDSNELCTEWAYSYSYSVTSCGGEAPEGGKTYKEEDPECTQPGYEKNDAGECVPKIINELIGKANCVYNKLNSSSTDFKDMIKKFDGDFPVSHLKYSIDNSLPANVNAVTNNSGQYLIEIKLNGNNLSQRTVLGLARTLIHETIHAEMYRKLRSVNYVVSINDFPGIYDYYRRYKNWQHQQMAQHYTEKIADMLKQFDNSQNTNQLYKDLAWEGLQGTVAWNNLSNSEKTRIINSVNNYKKTGNKNCN